MSASESKPLVSIITPSFNQAEFLEASLRSVLDQDYPHIEYLVVDGASTDGSVEIIARNAARLEWWVSEPDSGQAEAINKGFQRAKGEFVAWLNSDDLYLPGAITQAVAALQAHPQAAFVYGDLDSIRRDGSRFHTIRYQPYQLQDLLSFQMIGQPSVFMRRSLLEQAAFLDPSYHFLLDHHLWLRLAQQGEIVYVPRTWAAARHHSAAKNRAQAAGFGQEAFRILDWAREQPGLAPVLAQTQRQSKAGAYRLQARYLSEAGQVGDSLRSHLRAFALNPRELLPHWRRFLWTLGSALGLGWLVPESYESLKPILVTGMHRSGTSWVGRMLNFSQRTTYISEPLNVLHRRGVFDAGVSRWYEYVHPGNAQRFKPALERTLDLRYRLGRELRTLRSFRDFGRMLRDWWLFAIGRFARQRPLLKDPFALFSVPWFIEELDCEAVIVVRHPAAAVSSLKRLGWNFDFADLLAQSELMQAWLAPFRQEIEAELQREPDVIRQGALLWRMLYHTAHHLQQRHPHIRLVRHEDLSRRPLEEYEQLYLDLELPFGRRARRGIARATRGGNPSEVSLHDIYATRLDSQANLFNWKRRLTAEEIARIRAITADVADLFYSDEDWNDD